MLDKGAGERENICKDKVLNQNNSIANRHHEFIN